MSTQRDPDVVLAVWLDDGPTELPSATRRAISTAARMTPQARAGFGPSRWRLEMSRFIVLAAGTAVIVAAVGIAAVAGTRPSVGVGGQPSGSPAATGTTVAPSAAPTVAPSTGPTLVLPALTATFSSPWYGFSVRYPEGWRVTPGAGPWPIGRNLSHGDPHLDQIESETGRWNARIVGASIALPDGATMDDFRAFASPQGSPCTQLAPLSEPVTIDGVAALVSLNGCHSLSTLGGTIYDLLVITGGRGYDFTVDGYLGPDDVRTLLSAIKLEPDAARSAADAASPSP